jgi:hypothetical protein
VRKAPGGASAVAERPKTKKEVGRRLPPASVLTWRHSWSPQLRQCLTWAHVYKAQAASLGSLLQASQQLQRVRRKAGRGKESAIEALWMRTNMQLMKTQLGCRHPGDGGADCKEQGGQGGAAAAAGGGPHRHGAARRDLPGAAGRRGAPGHPAAQGREDVRLISEISLRTGARTSNWTLHPADHTAQMDQQRLKGMNSSVTGILKRAVSTARMNQVKRRPPILLFGMWARQHFPVF